MSAWRRTPVLVGALAGTAGVVLVAAAYVGTPSPADPRLPPDGTVELALDRPVNTFNGSPALGAGVDGLEGGEINEVWTPENLAAMRSAGFGSLSYRLRTELGVKAWHWNPQGRWSDSARRQGYWTSDTTMDHDPGVSYGYHLPRRGNTIDQANNDGYSRLADGDPRTFWKSNPYLDSHFTGEPDARHPQWMLAAFPEALPIDQVTIRWGTPYATRFRVQYWTGSDALHPAEPGKVGWKDFPAGRHAGQGGTQTVRVAQTPLKAQFVRVLMTADSDTAPAGSTDVRDRLGYAVRELSIGYEGGRGFVDHITHKPSQGQTTMYTSSTDPWHRAVDVDTDYEHASFARTYASGLTAGQPMMVPVPALYGTPEDAAALLRYLRDQDFPVQRIEIGEEPDGQLAQPEDYAALYLQMARAMKKVDPDVEFGGPGYQTVLPDWFAWPEAGASSRSWTGRFVAYLRARDAMAEFDFFSFEWYPFDDVCADPARPVAQHPALLAALMRRQEAAGLPPEVPKVITEYGYSSFAGQVELELPGAIVNAETAVQFLALGGETSYFYGLEPNWVFQEKEGKPCDTWGNLMLFQFYDEFKIRPIVTFHAAQLVNAQWAQPGTGEHTVFAATSDLRTAGGHPQVTAYPVRRPDGRLSVMLFNKDPKKPVTVRLMRTGDGAREPLPGALDLFQYSGEQWRWIPEKRNGGRPGRNDPPARSVVAPGRDATITLPPYSLSVVRTQDRLR
ncbi:discoidin domain-containing protein [Micromonospora pattaloongensis]|uniref:discoidin domain-containing protein n=1 Tax=Micromonospora pattaloongensis TaxID=405436 RepID=UPI000B84503E|nr:discoidin domain-containing protein [Micromonospora pattaloongensis]